FGPRPPCRHPPCLRPNSQRQRANLLWSKACAGSVAAAAAAGGGRITIAPGFTPTTGPAGLVMDRAGMASMARAGMAAMARAFTAGGGEAPKSAAVPPRAALNPPTRWSCALRLSSIRSLGCARQLRAADLVEHESIAGKNRSEPRRIRVGVVAIREQDVEIIVIRRPSRPVRRVVVPLPRLWIGEERADPGGACIP